MWNKRKLQVVQDHIFEGHFNKILDASLRLWLRAHLLRVAVLSKQFTLLVFCFKVLYFLLARLRRMEARISMGCSMYILMYILA